jgi:hypothetical protein
MGSTPDDGSDALLQQAIADYLVRVPAFAFGALLEIAGRQLPMGGAIAKIPARVGTVAPGSSWATHRQSLFLAGLLPA